MAPQRLSGDNHVCNRSGRDRQRRPYPHGRFFGDLAGLSAAELGAAAIRATLERAGLAAEAVDTVLMGCVLQARGRPRRARQRSARA